VTESAHLRVERMAEGYSDRLRGYAVMLDGRKVGTVRRGRTFEIGIEPGSHEVMLRVDWCSSPRVRFSAPPGEIVTYACRPGGPAWSLILRVLFDRKRYVAIDRVE
jgi:hypothetical protein